MTNKSELVEKLILSGDEIDFQIVNGVEIDEYLAKCDDKLKKAVSEQELIATVAGIIRARKVAKAQVQHILDSPELLALIAKEYGWVKIPNGYRLTNSPITMGW